MATTIQISQNLKKALDQRKISKNETYEEVVWNLVEEDRELSEQAKKEILEAEKRIKAGKFVNHKEVKSRFGL